MGSKVRFIEVQGSPYERGKSTGAVFRKPLKTAVLKYQKALDDEHTYKTMKKIETRVKAVFPHYLEEVYGRADGAGIDKDIYFLMMCAELLGEGTGCSSIVYRNPDGTIVLAHNEDDNFTVENSCITKCVTEKGWFATSDFYTMPFGNGFSWNSHGIAKIINFCPPLEINHYGIPRYFLQRHISEAVSVEDFVEKCNAVQCASGFHAIAVDVVKDLAVSVEITANEVSVTEIDDFYIHTNHYIHPSINTVETITKNESTSLFRYNRAKELFEQLIAIKSRRVSLPDLKKILQYRGTGFQDSILAVPGDPYLTFATFGVDTSRKNEITIDFHITEETVVYDYHIPQAAKASS